MFHAFVDGLARCWQLQTLDLRGNDFGKAGVDEIRALVAGLANCRQLQTLDLSSNNLNSLGLEVFHAFVDGLVRCQQLQMLDLSVNDLGRAGHEVLLSLLDRLSYCLRISSINLANNEFNEEQRCCIQTFINNFNARVAEVRTLLLCYNRLSKLKNAICDERLRKQEKKELPPTDGNLTSTGLADLPLEIIVKILEVGGYPVYRGKAVVQQPLTMSF